MMLCLGRKKGDVIILRIGDKTIGRIVIVEASDHRRQVRLGFDAHPDLVILRQEVADPGWRELMPECERIVKQWGAE